MSPDCRRSAFLVLAFGFGAGFAGRMKGIVADAVVSYEQKLQMVGRFHAVVCLLF